MYDNNYIFWMIIICIALPIYLAGSFIVVEDEETRKKVLIWGALIGSISFSILLFLQMKVELIYGKEILDYWYAINGDK